MSLVSPKRALISLSDKSNLDFLLKTLSTHQIEIVSSGGTYKAIVELGYEATEVSNYTQSPEILDGRVKTLHPKIHGGILAIRDNKAHQETLATHQIGPIDLVIVNLYPFDQAVADGASSQETIEKIDIGGPSMLRSAAKNHAFVTVITDPSQYEGLHQELQTHQGSIDDSFRKTCAQKAFEKTALYDASIAKYFQNQSKDFPTIFPMGLVEKMPLRYGENPHQQASFAIPSSQMGKSLVDQVLQGKMLSYNNLLDVHASVDLMLDVQKDFTVGIFKHTNPCGVARSTKSLKDAYHQALACDRVSAFGGIIVFSHPVDDQTAIDATQIFTEIMIAPGFSDKAKEILSKKKNLRLIEMDFEDASPKMFGLELKRVLDGFLVQKRDRDIEDVIAAKVVTNRKPTLQEYSALDLSWRISKHVKSNAIVLTDDCKTLGIGAGQMSRVDSTQIALSKIKDQNHSLIALGSDAFFPFRDSIDLIASHGITCVVQPGGSMRDEEVIQAANEHNIAMIFTSKRHFKH